MITVFFSEPENTSCAKKLTALLSRFGGALYTDGKSVLDFAPISSTYFISSSGCRPTAKSSAAFLLTDAACAAPLPVQDYRYILLNTDRAPQTDSCITVGLGSHRDITVSSLESRQMQVCLQRSLRTVGGKEIFPCEFTVQHPENADRQAVLYAVAILLLTDQTDTELLRICL